MPISLYNTMTNALEEFIPLNDGQVRMYTCGPTVYNYFHIGNARSFVMSDIIRRYFEYRGYEVTYVMNITDVDDKIIKTAIDEQVASSVIAERYTKAFLEDAKRFAIRPATVHPRATEVVADIVEHIKGLIANGSAYQIGNDVYFSVESFPGYGKLSGKQLDDLRIGARVDADERKHHPADFALWKSAKPGEPFWESPWGPGRPGWHIECSVMSQKYLGETFDIHAGGNDLIFPHHENEIAQSEALTHKPFARYWVHFGFLNVDNEKMSKSLGNFFTARDILDKYRAETLRFFYLQTHYRSPLNFSQEGIEAAKAGLHKLQALNEALEAEHADGMPFDIVPYENRFIEVMDSDINTPAGLGVLFELVRDVNTRLRSAEGMSALCRAEVRGFLQRTAGNVFGILGNHIDESGKDTALLNDIMQFLIDLRNEARQKKQWELSDRIRDGLSERHIILEDGRDGTKWKRKQ